MDPDRPLRTALINSARELQPRTGPVHAILLSGDIAYKGDRTEYQHAKQWLEALASAVKCAKENIFTVPGNHDCDRRTIQSKPEIGDIQEAIRSADHRWRDRELWNRLLKESTRDALIAPLAAYNEFAGSYGCHVFPPERVFWTAKFPLDHGIELHLRGINSTFLSGPNDTRGNLLVSNLQTAFDPIPGIIHAAMLHHPPDWLMDGDNERVDDALRNNTVLQFLGHKHRQRIQQVDTHIRYSAGAVNPDRTEDGWQPGYNVLELDIVKRDCRLLLRVVSHLMDWQSSPDRFRKREAPDGGTVFEHFIDIGAVGSSTAVEERVEKIEIATEPPAPIKAAGVHLPEASVKEKDTRNLVFRFWKLTASQRREIALDLGLVGKADLELPEAERYRRAFEKASALDLVDRLALEVKKREAQENG